MMEMTMKGATSTANMNQACSMQRTTPQKSTEGQSDPYLAADGYKPRLKRLVGVHTASEKGSQCGVEGNDRAHARWDAWMEISAIRGKRGRERPGGVVVSSELLLHASSLVPSKRAAMHACPSPPFPSGCRHAVTMVV